jgi:hypothetical protein
MHLRRYGHLQHKLEEHHCNHLYQGIQAETQLPSPCSNLSLGGPLKPIDQNMCKFSKPECTKLCTIVIKPC